VGAEHRFGVDRDIGRHRAGEQRRRDGDECEGKGSNVHDQN
jgi:hypothetical protein